MFQGQKPGKGYMACCGRTVTLDGHAARCGGRGAIASYHVPCRSQIVKTKYHGYKCSACEHHFPTTRFTITDYAISDGVVRCHPRDLEQTISREEQRLDEEDCAPCNGAAGEGTCRKCRAEAAALKEDREQEAALDFVDRMIASEHANFLFERLLLSGSQLRRLGRPRHVPINRLEFDLTLGFIRILDKKHETVPELEVVDEIDAEDALDKDVETVPVVEEFLDKNVETVPEVVVIDPNTERPDTDEFEIVAAGLDPTFYPLIREVLAEMRARHAAVRRGRKNAKRLKPTMVGGDGDCWQEMFFIDGICSGNHVTAQEIVDACVGNKALVCVNPMTKMWVDWCRQEDDDFHVYQVARKGVMHRRDTNGTWSDIDDFLKILSENAFKVVGAIDVNAMIQSTAKTCQTTIAANAAATAFRDELENLPVVRTRLTEAESIYLERELGYKVRCLNTRRNDGGHSVIAAQRELARSRLISQYDRHTDKTTALHVGATMHEVKQWWANPGHDFLLNLVEDKDIYRVIQTLVQSISSRLVNAGLPCLQSAKGKTTRLDRLTLQEMLDLLSDSRGRRVFLSLDDVRPQYNVLFFEDCAYEMDENQMLAYFEKTGAFTAHMVLFVPDEIVDPDAPPSEIYRYEEVLPGEEVVREWLDYVWPEIVVAYGVIPGNAQITDMILNVLRSALARGADFLKDLLTKTIDATTLSAFVGPAFEFFKVKAILESFIAKAGRFLWDRLSYCAVTWKSGVGNGYRHKSRRWKSWVANRRIRGPFFSVDWELRERHGLMYIYDMHKSTGSSDIQYTVALAPAKAYVRVLDLFDSYSKGWGIDNKRYVTVAAADWERIVNWALAEPIESLSFGVLMTTINRVRKGLSLGENVIVPPMNLEAKYVRTLALAVLCEVGQISSIVDAVERDAEIKKCYESNLAWVGKTLAKGMATAFTTGWALPAYYMIKWLLTESKIHEFVLYTNEPERVHVRGRKSKLKPKDLMNGVSLVLPHTPAHQDIDCYMCKLQASGAFSISGIASEGQTFTLENHDNTSTQEYAITPEVMVPLITRVMQAKDDHRTMGANTLVRHIDGFLNHLRAHEHITVRHKMNVHRLRGGPGVGKSMVARVLAKSYANVGKLVHIGFPFRNLINDYKQAEVIGFQGRHDFNAQTFWYLTEHRSVNVLILDEASSIDADLTAVLCWVLGVEELYIIGDEKQTHLDSARGEGVDLMNYEDPERMLIKVDQAPTHTFVTDYRNPPLIVKLLNHKLGYRMRSTRVDYDNEDIKFLTTAQYQEFARTEKIDREMVFSHASAQLVFGKVSDPNSREPGANMSVRSSQGKTYDTVALGVTDLDDHVLEITGMRCVAISRHRNRLVLVANSWTDRTALAFKQWMCHETDAEREVVQGLSWPPMVDVLKKRTLGEDDARLDKMIRMLAKKGRVSVQEEEVLPNEEEPERMIEGLELRVKEKPPAIEITPRVVDFGETWRDVFNYCFFEEVRRKWPDLKEDIDAFLTEVYFDPNYVGVRHQQDTWSKLTIDKDGKFVLSLELVSKFCARHKIGLSLWTKGNCRYANKLWRDEDRNAKQLDLEYDKSHIGGQAELQAVKHGDIDVDPLQFFESDGVQKRNWRRADDARSEKAKKKATGFWGTPDLTGDQPIGYSKVQYPDIPRPQLNLATEHAQITSSWGLPKLKPFSLVGQPSKAGKHRDGTDAFRMIPFIDNSDAQIDHGDTMPHATVRGVVEDVKMSVMQEGFLGLMHTKAGALKRKPIRQPRAFCRGTVNAYHGGDAETLVGCQRLALALPKPELDSETDDWARRVADNFVQQAFDIQPDDEEVNNLIVQQALRDARTRNYHGRAEAERRKDPLGTPKIMAANKAQFKFKMPFDPYKGGQPLSMGTSLWNLKFVPFFRVRGYRVKQCFKPDVMVDDYEGQADFVKRVTEGLRLLPDSAQFLIVDAVKFDSQQSAVTLRIEYYIHKALGANLASLDEYNLIRGSGLTWSLLGRAKGKTSGNKPSGLPDTKLGNTLVEGALAMYKYQGQGPRLVAMKGDDFLLAQSDIVENQQHSTEIKRYTGMVLVEKLGDSGAFIGYAVDRTGFVPDVVKRVYKALAARARDYKQFTQHQQAYRDLVEEVRLLGGAEAAERGAVAVGCSASLGGVAFAILNSLGHMSESDWRKRTKIYAEPVYHPRAADGPTLL